MHTKREWNTELFMKIIAHRGNLNGPNFLTENSPDQINLCISKGYDVEIDVWYIDENFYLGHDKPIYKISFSYLLERKEWLWIHCKNQDALYKFNNLGYRSNIDYTDDLKNSRVILMLGCSDTWGRFVEYNKIYSELVQQQMPDSVVVNMSVPGGSPDQITRLGVQTISYLKSAITDVCMFWPGFSLREFVSKSFKSGTYILDQDNVPYKDWWDHIDWVSNNYNYQKNKILIESICQAHNINYYDLIVNREDTVVPFDYIPNGPETVFGEVSHCAMANYFYKKINKQASLFESTK